MKKGKFIQILIWMLLIHFYAIGQDEMKMLVTDSNLQLLNLTYNIKDDNSNTTLFFNFFFNRKCQNFFYHIDKDEKSIAISFLNTMLGELIVEDTVLYIDKGPLISLQIKQRIEDKNKEVKGLKPEYYYVTDAVLKCSRIPLSENVLKFTEKDDMVSMSLPWPGVQSERDALYSSPPKKKRKGLIAALAGIGAAGLAGGTVLLFTLLSEDEDPNAPLQVNLPVHPANP